MDRWLHPSVAGNSSPPLTLERIMSDRVSVLVVEDEPIILMDIADQLEGEGFDVFKAENADVAIAILDDNPSIRLIFTDIDMPGSMDGLKLAAAVRERWPPALRPSRSAGIYARDAGDLSLYLPVTADVVKSVHA